MAATINEGNGTTVESVPNPQNPPATTTVQANPQDESGFHFNMKQLVRIWKYISVEPVILCWLLPSCLLFILVENLALEKSCRVEFKYDDYVCDNMIDKSINNINCPEFREKVEQPPEQFLHLYKDRSQLLNDTTWKNGSSILVSFRSNATILFDITQLEEQVCNAEVNSQILETQWNVLTAPFDTVFGILMILFAGGWSDRMGRRKPCMLIPILGELGSLIAMLVAVVFFKQLPLWFSSVLSKLLPAMGGGANLMLMGVYSYLSETTAEEDRTFRFSIFALIVPIIPILSVPWSGYLFAYLGYIKLLLICIPINLIGILYILFELDEVKQVKNENLELQAAGVDNPAFETEGQMQAHESQNQNSPRPPPKSAEPQNKPNVLVTFFNPIVVIQCFEVIMRKRENQGRAFLIFLFVLYFVAIGPAFGEEPNEYNFTRIKLNWGGKEYGTFSTYGSFLSLAGTVIMVAVLNKWLKFSDPTLGIIGTSFSAVSRIIYCMATTSAMMWIARTFDAFISIRALVIKSILSKIVHSDELGRLFSIIGIIEALGKFVFLSIYSLIYEQTLSTWPAAFYFLSLVFLVLTALLFVLLYFIVKRRDRQEAAQKSANLDAAEKKKTDLGETTHM